MEQDLKYIKQKISQHVCLWWKIHKSQNLKFNGVIKTNLLGDEVPKENVHYICIACITIDSVMKIKKMNYPQVYL